MGILVKSMGFVFSLLPYCFLEFATELLGMVFVLVPSKRRRLLFSNLKHAFPEWSDAKIKSVASQSAARMFEMGFFSLAYPFLSKEKLKRTVLYSSEVENQLEKYSKGGKPTLILLPHLCLFETLATSPYFRPQGGKSLGAVYRPNRNHELDRWINKARLKTGVLTFARKAGLLKARDHLRKGNWLVVLFDQNAGIMGTGSVFLDRICSISPLPDLLGKTPELNCFYAFPKRLSFFQSQLEIRPISKKTNGFAVAAHSLLAEDIMSCPDGMPEWLWSHGKWKTNDSPHEFFQLQDQKKLKLNFPVQVRKTKIWIRMPNWLGDIVMALPVIRAIRLGRPDAAIVLLCKKQYVDFLKSVDLSEEVIALPQAKGFRYFAPFLKLRKHYPDAMLLFTNSFRGDLEAFLIGAKVRFGMVKKHRRPLLNATWEVPGQEIGNHQTRLWEGLARNLGLRQKLDFSPLASAGSSDSLASGKLRVGVAPGSSNTPGKRLPVESWIEVCEILRSELQGTTFSIELYGTKEDENLCKEIQSSLPGAPLVDFSGKTNLVELTNHFRELDVLVCNDSGAMHLANAFGCPVVAIFGPTDPSVTGPVFETPAITIQSESGKSMKSIEPKIIAQAVLKLFR